MKTRTNASTLDAVVQGYQSAAFGGKRYDKLSDTSRTPTSAEGNQSFAAGGSVHAMADFCTALGKDGFAYQKGSFTASMKGSSGMSETEFNTYYWDSINNVALHSGKGKNSDGKILDEFGKTYADSYSTAATFGDGNNCKGYADFGVGAGNKSWGSCNFIAGKSNLIESGKQVFVFGENCSVTGDVGNSFVCGRGLKNPGRWNKMILGQYNNPDQWNILEIGGGESDSSRANIFSIKSDGAVLVGKNLSFTSGTRFQVADLTRKLIDCRNNGVTHIESYVSTRNSSVGFQNQVAKDESSALQTISDATAANLPLLNTMLVGEGLINKGRYNQVVVGQYNQFNAQALFQVGTGNSDTDRKSGFEVLWNGKARSTATPVDENDYVRMKELSVVSNRVTDLANKTLPKTSDNKIALTNGGSLAYVTAYEALAGAVPVYDHDLKLRSTPHFNTSLSECITSLDLFSKSFTFTSATGTDADLTSMGGLPILVSFPAYLVSSNFTGTLDARLDYLKPTNTHTDGPTYRGFVDFKQGDSSYHAQVTLEVSLSSYTGYGKYWLSFIRS